MTRNEAEAIIREHITSDMLEQIEDRKLDIESDPDAEIEYDFLDEYFNLSDLIDEYGTRAERRIVNRIYVELGMAEEYDTTAERIGRNGTFRCDGIKYEVTKAPFQVIEHLANAS